MWVFTRRVKRIIGGKFSDNVDLRDLKNNKLI